MDDRIQEIERRLAYLEEQLARLQSNGDAAPPTHTTLVAPVRVIGADGTTVLEISATRHDRSLRLHNSSGQVVATLGADGTQSGYLAIRNSAGVLVGYLDVEVAGARLQLLDHEARGGVVLFGGDSGDDAGGGITIMATNGTGNVSLWAGTDHGEVTVYGAAESVIATLPSGAES